MKILEIDINSLTFVPLFERGVINTNFNLAKVLRVCCFSSNIEL
jgi:hypothetical protein